MLAVLTALLVAAAPAHDTVFLREGGRLVGTVTADTKEAVVVQLLDGTIRRLDRADVVRIEYRDGTESAPPAGPPSLEPALAGSAIPPAQGAAVDGPPPSYPPDYLPPEAYTPRPPAGGELPPGAPEPLPGTAPPARPPPREPPAWAALGLGGAFLGGEVEPGVRVGRIFTPQVNLQLEAGLALGARLGVALYLDLGAGGAGSDARAYCRTYGLSCSAETLRVGLLLRDTFAVGERTRPWAGIGTGFAYGHVAAAGSGEDDSREVLQYWGWEMLRVQGGVDWRRWDTVALGAYAAVSYVLYTRYQDAGGKVALPATSTHALAEAGLRAVFYPP